MIREGDKCWVQLPGGKKHYGVCTGYGSDCEPWFVHNTRQAGVAETTRKGFAGNRPINVEQSAPPGYEAVVAARARSLIGRDYSMLSFNCEHVASLATTGQAESKQVQRGVIATSLLTAALLALANENGTSVDSNGYRRGKGGKFAARRWW